MSMFFSLRHRTLAFLTSIVFLQRSNRRAALAFTHHHRHHAFRHGSTISWLGNCMTSLLKSATSPDATTPKCPSITDNLGVTLELWSVYESTLRDVIADDRLSNKKPCDVVAVNNYLLSNQSLVDVFAVQGQNRSETREQLKDQKKKFIQLTGFSDDQYEYCLKCLTYLGDFCAKRQTPQPLMVAWYKMKESGMIPRENGISTYMYVLNLDETFAEASAEVASFHDLLYEPNEKTITLRIKALIAKNDALGAEQLLASLPDKSGGSTYDWRRLRTFLPIVCYYCTTNDLSSVLRIFRQMRNSSGTHLDVDTYALILSTLARSGSFGEDSKPIEGAAAAGFSATHGSRLFDDIATEMASDIMELTDASARVLHQAISEGFCQTGEGWISDVFPNAVSIPAAPLDVVADRVEIDNATALCPRTGAKLRLFALDSKQRKHVHDTLLTMAEIQHIEMLQKFVSPRQSHDPDYATRELSKFSQWLEEREGAPFTALVDGPNVAYFSHSNVRYSQIDLIVNKLVNMGEQPLVIMPEKYISARFAVSSGCIQKLTQRELDVVERLRDSEMLYVVPSRCLDDYYWMLGSVSNQTRSRRDSVLYIPPRPDSGRFPGLRPMLVTNDRMRDHKLALLEPRLFQRWSSCHIVNYNISSYDVDEWEERDVHFIPADFFSREIQGNLLQDGSCAWHFPVAEWRVNDRLCIRLPVNHKSKELPE